MSRFAAAVALVAVLAAAVLIGVFAGGCKTTAHDAAACNRALGPTAYAECVERNLRDE